MTTKLIIASLLFTPFIFFSLSLGYVFYMATQDLKANKPKSFNRKTRHKIIVDSVTKNIKGSVFVASLIVLFLWGLLIIFS